jgi:hypothetical protein
LLLARVDGKSPAEYLTDEDDKNLVRNGALEMLRGSPESLADILMLWSRAIASR